MNNWRKAKCIELHDSNIAFTTSDEKYTDDYTRGRTPFANKKAYSINLGDISMIGQLFGQKPYTTVDVPAQSDQEHARSGERAPSHSIEIPIYKNHFDVAYDLNDPERIIKLECEIQTDKAINILVTLQDEYEGIVREEISYSGSYTIWWDELTPAENKEQSA